MIPACDKASAWHPAQAREIGRIAIVRGTNARLAHAAVVVDERLNICIQDGGRGVLIPRGPAAAAARGPAAPLDLPYMSTGLAEYSDVTRMPAGAQAELSDVCARIYAAVHDAQ